MRLVGKWRNIGVKSALLMLGVLASGNTALGQEIKPNLLPPGAQPNAASAGAQFYQPGVQTATNRVTPGSAQGADSRYQYPPNVPAVGLRQHPALSTPSQAAVIPSSNVGARYGALPSNPAAVAAPRYAAPTSAPPPSVPTQYAEPTYQRQAMRQPPQTVNPPTYQPPASAQKSPELKVANSYRTRDASSARTETKSENSPVANQSQPQPQSTGFASPSSSPAATNGDSRQFKNPYRDEPAVRRDSVSEPTDFSPLSQTGATVPPSGSVSASSASIVPPKANGNSPQRTADAEVDTSAQQTYPKRATSFQPVETKSEEADSVTSDISTPKHSADPASNKNAPTASETNTNPADAELAELTARVKQRTEELQAATEIEEQVKTDALEVLKSANEWLTRAAQWNKKRADFLAEAAAVPAAITETKELLAKEKLAIEIQLASDAGLIQMEQVLSETETTLKSHQQSLTEQENQLKQRAERKAAIAKQLEQLDARLAEIKKSLAAGMPEGVSPQLSQAQVLELTAKEYSSKAEKKLLQAENARHDAVVELLPLLRDLAQKLVKEHEALVATWQEKVADYRKQESERQAREARERVSAAHPALKALAERNAELAESRTELAEKIEAVQGELEWIQSTLKEIDEQHKSITEKVKVVGLSSTVGLLLRKQRGELPHLDYHHDRLLEIEEELPQIQLTSLELEEERESIGDINAAVETVVANLSGVATQFAPEELSRIVKQFLETKKQYLNDLHNDIDAYQDELGELDIITRKLTHETTEFSNYIDKHVLWIRSAEPVTFADVKQSWNALSTIGSFPTLSSVAKAIKLSLQQRPFQWLAMIFGFLFLRLAASRIRTKLESEKSVKGEDEKTSITAILASLGLTLFNAMMWPALVWLIGWQLDALKSEQELIPALASGLMLTSVLCIALEITRQACMPGGLAEEYLDWPSEKMRLLRHKIRWLMWLGLPAVFGVVLLERLRAGEWADSAGRLLFIAGMGLLAILSHGLLRPSSVLWKKSDETTKPGLVQRLQYLWYVVGMAAPLGLAWLATTGYYYSASELAVRLKMSFWLLIATVLAASLLTRLLFVVAQGVNRHKRLGRKANTVLPNSGATHETESQIAETTETEEDSNAVLLQTVAPNLPKAAEEDFIDLVHVRGQVTRLIQGVALICFVLVSYNIWAEVLPAFRVLDKVELWSSVQDVTDNVTDPDGNVTLTVVKKSVPTTLSHLIVALALFQITILAAKNLPGLLEIAVLNRLPIDRGGRYAVSVICRYTLTVAGFMMGFQMLGLTWSSVQWLIAAMTVGLGFGLQEIFANFVSGMIILFERPVRVGDLVTIGGQTGHVTRVQIRATTLTDFDRRELIIPNKNFITGELINWTLSDPITRVVIPIGVAYGTDVELTQRTLMEVSQSHSMVLKEPAASAMFTSFGDSTLNFELRIYLGSREKYGQVLHELNSAIDKAFRAAKIEIAFPQQEVTIKSVAAFAPLVNQTGMKVEEVASEETTPAIHKAA